MCNHKYTRDRSGYGPKGDECPYTEWYRELNNKKISNHQDSNSQLELPLDSTGVCLFHSHDLNWKREKQFTKKFLQLVQLLDEYSSKEYYDFCEFVFVGEQLESKKNSESYIFKLVKTVFMKEAKFAGAVFTEAVKFHNVEFKSYCSFEGAAFKDKLVLEKCSLASTYFDATVFEKNVYFEDDHFCGTFAIFTHAVFYNSVRFLNTKFDGMAVFSDAVFNKSKDDAFAATFQNVVFKNSAIFTGSIFFCPAEFRSVIFNLNAEFIDTLFGASKSSLRYIQKDVSFINIGLNKNGLLIFEGRDAKTKMFDDTDADISFKGEVKGIIRFKNVNFNNIIQESREELFNLEKAGRVEIGPGCIKYRFQTETKTIPADSHNQSLILEITQTFCNYFAAKNGMNLGFEIVSREKDKIRFFYFTDEDITEEEFFDRLKTTEQDLWDLLYRSTSQQVIQSNQFDILDLKINLLGIFLKIGIGIKGDRFKDRKDVEVLLDSFNFAGISRFKVDDLSDLIQKNFIGLQRKITSSVKTLETNLLKQLKESSQPSNSRQKKLILFLSANQKSEIALYLDEEYREIREALNRSKNREQFDTEALLAIRFEDLHRALLECEPYIVHFAGHGTHEGLKILDDTRFPAILRPDVLAQLFQHLSNQVECVILSACYSVKQAESISKYIPYVVGMQKDIEDEAGIEFARGFYDALGAGKTIEEAVKSGRLSIRQNCPDQADHVVTLLKK